MIVHGFSEHSPSAEATAWCGDVTLAGVLADTNARWANWEWDRVRLRHRCVKCEARRPAGKAGWRHNEPHELAANGWCSACCCFPDDCDVSECAHGKHHPEAS